MPYFDPKEQLWVGAVDVGMVGRPAQAGAAQGEDEGRAGGQAARGRAGPRRTACRSSTRPPPRACWLDFWLTKILPGTVASVHGGHVPPSGQGLDRPTRTSAGCRWRSCALKHVITMIRDLEARGLSPTTQRKARTVLRRALTVAERYGRVSKNAAALTDAPKQTGTVLDDTLTAAQAAAILAAAEGDRLEALAVLVLAVGVRQAEALDLRRDALDLDTGTIAVHGTKTAASDRRVGLPPFVVAALRRHQTTQKSGAHGGVAVGRPRARVRHHGRYPLRPAQHPALVAPAHHQCGRGAAALPRQPPHRGTLMLNAGVPLEVVSATLGHAGLAITADVYAAVLPDLQRGAATAMKERQAVPYDPPRDFHRPAVPGGPATAPTSGRSDPPPPRPSGSSGGPSTAGKAPSPAASSRSSACGDFGATRAAPMPQHRRPTPAHRTTPGRQIVTTVTVCSSPSGRPGPGTARPPGAVAVRTEVPGATPFTRPAVRLARWHRVGLEAENPRHPPVRNNAG